MIKRFFFLIIAVSGVLGLPGQETNYDESSVPVFEMPDLLMTKDGSPVVSASDWEKIRRPEILSLFEEFVYGRTPAGEFKQSYEVAIHQQNALNGLADKYEVIITKDAISSSTFLGS